jgi:acetyl-CoA synthetase
VSYSCLDRHVEEGRGRVAFHWTGEEGEERAFAYGELHCDVQRLTNELKISASARATSSGSTTR